MEFILRRNIIKFIRDKYAITDNAGNECFYVESEINVVKRLLLEDLNGNPLILMKKRYFRMFARWDVKNANGDTLFIIKRKRIPLVKKFRIINVSEENPAKYEVNGKVLAWNIKITRDEQIIATIKTSLVKIANTYSVDITEEKETLRCLAIAIVIDAVCHPRRRMGSGNGGILSSLLGH